MSSAEKLKQALNEQHDTIAAHYAEIVKQYHTQLTQKFGPCLNLRDANQYEKQMGSLVLSATSMHDPITGEQQVAGRRSSHRRINNDKLNHLATRFAEGVIEAWYGKLLEKLDGVDEYQVNRLDASGDLAVSGQLGERKVFLTQQRVMKWSNKGTLFYQFPALIYVDDKRVTAAAFRKLVAG